MQRSEHLGDLGHVVERFQVGIECFLEGGVGAVVYVFVAGFFEEGWGRVDCGIHATDSKGDIRSSCFGVL